MLAARFRLRLGDGSGLTAWRKAARDLAAWKDGKNARARARAVELAATAAMAEGAPADEIIEEARRFGGARGDLSLPALAYRVALARRQFAQNKPAAAKRTLATTMEELRKRLDARSPKDRYLSRTYNDAVQWAAQERKLGLKFEFLLEEHVDLGVRYSVPAGGRWTIHKKTASRPAIEQRDPDGQLVREIAVHGIPEGTHKAVGLAHEPDPKKRVARWENRARREMPKLKKLKKPKAVTINRTLGRAYVLEAIGGGPVKSRRRFLAYEWTGKHNKRHYTLLIDEYNNADPKDPALAAFFESLREE